MYIYTCITLIQILFSCDKRESHYSYNKKERNNKIRKMFLNITKHKVFKRLNKFVYKFSTQFKICARTCSVTCYFTCRCTF